MGVLAIGSMSRLGQLLLLPLLASACGRAPAGPLDAAPPEVATPAVPKALFDPLLRLPEVGPDVGLHDVSGDLSEVLDGSVLAGACARYRAGETDRRTVLACGKWMFFYETFGTAGLPGAIPRFLLSHFPEVGAGFSSVGLIKDPASKDQLPLGLAPVVGRSDQLAFTCASSHFARLPDGRYAVGAPNHAYDYGVHTLQMMLFPTVALRGSPQDHDLEAVAKIQPLLSAVQKNPLLKLELLGALLPLLGSGGKAPAFPVEAEAHYARWRSGTMDFVIEPLLFNDHVHTVSKIPALWGLPPGEHQARLGWTGSTGSVLRFLELFVGFGGGKISEWPRERLLPLAEYLGSLRPVPNPSALEAAQVQRGLLLFNQKGCLECHGGEGGAGERIFTFAEMGTDDALADWLAPSSANQPCCGVPLTEQEITRGVKAPRLVGLWAARRFLHNGSLSTLEELFCLAGPRGPTLAKPFGNQGHDFTCEALTPEEKRALIAYLEAR